MRIQTHVVDTTARRLVPNIFPAEWEHRESTGRDYGIDMTIELFRNGQATGTSLLLQIKGTEKEIDNTMQLIPFDMPVQTLRYAEVFVVPVLLVFCPIHVSSTRCYYIWLQDYIKTVLDFEKAGWRKHISTVRLQIPTDNVMPGKEAHLMEVSYFPQRLFGATNVARILEDVRHKLDGLPSFRDYGDVHDMLSSLHNLPGVFDGSWKYGDFIYNQSCLPAIIASDLLCQRRCPSKDEIEKMPIVRAIGSSLKKTGFPFAEEGELVFDLKSQVQHALNCLNSLYEETNYSLKHTLWVNEGIHSF